MDRTKIMDAIIKEQQKVIDNLKESVDRYALASDIEEDSTIDPDDLSQQVQAKDMQLRFEQLLKKAQDEMSFLVIERDLKHEIIEKGSLVNLNDALLFIGLSLPKFDYSGKTFMSFSTDAPAFKNVEDKKVGDQISLGNQMYSILSIL